MKKIINGKMYNTEAEEKAAEIFHKEYPDREIVQSDHEWESGDVFLYRLIMNYQRNVNGNHVEEPQILRGKQYEGK